MAVTPLGGGVYEVDSESDHVYLVDVESGRCTCPDHVFRHTRCKHLRRVAIEINEGRVPPPRKKAEPCVLCGATAFVPENDAGPFLHEACEIRPGDVLVDRRTGDPVVALRQTDRRADEVVVPGRECTVADYPTNEAYADDDPVVEVVYPVPSDLDPDDVKPYHVRRYSFPLSRLERPRSPAETPGQTRLAEYA